MSTALKILKPEALTDCRTQPARLALATRRHGRHQHHGSDVADRRSEHLFHAMVRVTIPGGRMTSRQYLELDRFQDEPDSALRLTARQAIEFRFGNRRSLPSLMAQLQTIELPQCALGRGLSCCAAPIFTGERRALHYFARELAHALRLRQASIQVWLDGELAAGMESGELEGDPCLPPAFTIGFASEGENTTDIYNHDLAFVAHFDCGGLAGFTVLAGGGFGKTNSLRGGVPRVAEPIGFIRPGSLAAAAQSAISIHRDFCEDEPNAPSRLKYVVAACGAGWFRLEMGRRMGEALAPPRRLIWHRGEDYLGWHRQGDGRWFYGVRVPAGVLRDTPEQRLRSAIHRVVEVLSPGVRLTVQQNLLLTGIAPEDRDRVNQVFSRHGVTARAFLPPVLRESMACPASPSCSQAVGESERIWPEVAARIQRAWDDAGLVGAPLCVRMSACANGCARPYTAEIGIVGRRTGFCDLYLGGCPLGTRLARLFAREVPVGNIAGRLAPLFTSYALQCDVGERFGDWVSRQGIADPPAAPAVLEFPMKGGIQR